MHLLKPTDDGALEAFARGQVSVRLSNLAFDARAARQKPDAETIHDLRVAIRRLSQGLSVFSTLFPEAETRKIRRRLNKALDLGGAVRDRDIALEILDEADLPATAGIRKCLRSDRKSAEREVVQKIVKWNMSDFSARWRSGLRLTEEMRPPDRAGWTPSQTVADIVSKVLPPMSSDVFRAGRQALSAEIDLNDLHDFRLLVKKFRYTVEIFEPIYGPALRKRLKSLRKLQDFLGRISDCATTAGLLKKTAKRHKRKKRETAPILDYVRNQERTRITELSDHWRTSFDTPGQEEHWIRYLRDYAGRSGRRPST